jgi:hypothetical protein
MISNLQKYQKMLSADQELAKLVPYRVVRKGANERARVAKALQSKICEDTVAALHDNHQRWMQDPSAFWTGPLPRSVDSPDTHVQDPHVQIVARNLQTNPDNE